MTEAEQGNKDETYRVFYALEKFTDTFKTVRLNHIQRVYREEKFLHGEVPVNLDERLELGIRIVFLQVRGILHTPNLPRHFALRLIRNLADMSVSEIRAKTAPNIIDLDRAILWKEIVSILDSPAEKAA